MNGSCGELMFVLGVGRCAAEGLTASLRQIERGSNCKLSNQEMFRQPRH